MIIDDIEKMSNEDVIAFLKNSVNKSYVKNIVQYINSPYTKKFNRSEFELSQPLKETKNSKLEYETYSDNNLNSIANAVRQIKSHMVQNPLLFINKYSARFNRECQELLMKVLCKEININIDQNELFNIYPDTDLFVVSKEKEFDNIEELIPAMVFPVKEQFKRLITVSCVNRVMFFRENGELVEIPPLLKSMEILSGGVPIVYDGYQYKDYYLLNDVLVYGDFKTGISRYKYKKRYDRLKEELSDFHNDKKVSNSNIMAPTQLLIDTKEKWDKFIEQQKNVKDTNKYIVKNLDNNYEYCHVYRG